MTVKVNNQEIPSCMEIQGVYSKVQITGYIQEQEGQTTFSQKKKTANDQQHITSSVKYGGGNGTGMCDCHWNRVTSVY